MHLKINVVFLSLSLSLCSLALARLQSTISSNTAKLSLVIGGFVLLLRRSKSKEELRVRVDDITSTWHFNWALSFDFRRFFFSSAVTVVLG